MEGDGSRDETALMAAQSIVTQINREHTNSAPNSPINNPRLTSSYLPIIDDTPVIRYPANPVYSINETGMADCLVEGSEDDGTMSAVRRFFCLFVTFDLLFTTLLWFICVVITGESKEEVKREVLNYNINTSLFDIIMVSLCRVVLLLLVYALCRISHWWMVALTTAGSSAFLLVKVFLYDWKNYTHNNNFNVFSVLLILCSFVIAWGETWFLDFRVIPQEKRARDFLAAGIQAGTVRDPLLTGGGVLPRYDAISHVDTLTFYSPLQSQQVSDDEDDASPAPTDRLQREIQNDDYRKRGKEAMDLALQRSSADDWKLQRSTKAGDEVFAKIFTKQEKVFKLKSTINMKPKKLLEELFYKFENVSHWNASVSYCKILQIIDNNTDITYQITTDLANGVISSRDFVTLRHWEQRGDTYTIGVISVTHPTMPVKKDCIRGENGAGGFFLRPCGDYCEFEWILNIKLKGWLPKYLVEQTIAGIMIEYVEGLRKHLEIASMNRSV